MGSGFHEEIRNAVRKRYGSVAKSGFSSCGQASAASCCGTSGKSGETIPMASSGCCGPGVSLDEVSQAVGYSKEDMDGVPEGANMGLGCGNPVALASLTPGETVVDLGSGGGFDCFLAAKAVGPTGQVIGVDMTPEMLGKARKNANDIGAENVEFRLGEIEHLPIADNSADIIMSNCVINLSPDKHRVYQDAYRVLKPGGRLAISDIVATAPLPEEVQKNLDLVCSCMGGAATIADTEKCLREAGFQDVRIQPNKSSEAFIREWDSGKSSNAADYVVSASIEALKPLHV